MDAYGVLELEKILVKALLQGSPASKAFLLRRLRKEHFSSAGDLFEYIQKNMALGDGKLLEIQSLAVNPGFSSTVQGIAASLQYVNLLDDPMQLEEACKPIIEAYNQATLLETIRPTIESLQKGEMVTQDAMGRLQLDLETQAQILANNEMIPLSLGKGADFDKAVARTLTPESNNFIRSGIKSIDMRVGGFSRGDIVVLAAPSSHGKTLAMIQFLNNMLFNSPNQKISALYVTMEVQDTTVMHRVIANRASLPLKRVRETTMPEELLIELAQDKTHKLDEVKQMRELCAAEMARINENLDTSGHKLEIKPYGAFTPEDLMRELALYPYDVVILDYLNLMTTVQSSDADWLRLSNITRQLKNIATTKKILIVTAQQLDETTKDIRYAKAVKEHCDVLIVWELPQELREAGGGVADMKIKKGRNIGTFSFPMHFDLTTQKVVEVDSSEGINPLDASTTLGTPDWNQGFNPVNDTFNPDGFGTGFLA